MYPQISVIFINILNLHSKLTVLQYINITFSLWNYSSNLLVKSRYTADNMNILMLHFNSMLNKKTIIET